MEVNELQRRPARPTMKNVVFFHECRGTPLARLACLKNERSAEARLWHASARLARFRSAKSAEERVWHASACLARLRSVLVTCLKEIQAKSTQPQGSLKRPMSH